MNFRRAEKCSQNACMGPPIRLESRKGMNRWSHKPHFSFSIVNGAFFEKKLKMSKIMIFMDFGSQKPFQAISANFA